jgi:2-iminoacetate synthase ThiH
MVDNRESPSRTVVRVVIPNQPAFQLRKGEEGISVFEATAVEPALTTEEILDSFRSDSQSISRAVADIEAKGLRVVILEGAETLPQRLRQAHREIRPGSEMNRQEFKRALKELE